MARTRDAGRRAVRRRAGPHGETSPTISAARFRPGEPLTPASIVAAQAVLGNQAVQRLVQRNGVAPPPAPVAPAPAAAGPAAGFRPVADIDAMKLGELDRYAAGQADWASDPALPAARKTSLVRLLEWARAEPVRPVSACTDMTVASLEPLANPDMKGLTTYARAVEGSNTLHVNQISDTPKAVEWGKAIDTLEPAVGKPVLHHAMKQETGKTQLEDMIAAGEVANFASYVKTGHPYIEAENGADVASYLTMVSADGKHPADYIGKLTRVRNYHRHEAEMLDKLHANLGDKSRAKPLLLILQSASDHNGAFHRDHEKTNMVKDAHNLSLMVEGATSLEQIGSEAQDIAREYGQRHRIQQLMIAGHGDSRAMELTAAGPTLGGGPPARGSIDLDHNRKRTEAFLRGLVGNMDTGPDARIALHACLTAAEDVNATLDPDPAKARAQILASLSRHPSLAGRLQAIAGSHRTVMGNVSSVPAGTYHDPATGLLAPTVPSDPEATNPDLANYMEKGAEVEGCMRAALVTWARNEAEWLRRLTARLARPITDWNDRVVHVFYGMINAAPADANLMNKLARIAARGLGEFEFAEMQNPDSVAGMYSDFTAPQTNTIFSSLRPHIAVGGKLAIDQVWMNVDATKRAQFLATLDSFATPAAAQQHLQIAWVEPEMTNLLPVASASTLSTAQAKLALWAVTGGRASAGAVAFLHAGAAATRHLVMPAGTTAAGLLAGTGSDETAVLETIGLGAAVPAATTGPTATGAHTPNVDLDGDGTNDFYVAPLTRHGVVTARSLNVRSHPGVASPRLGAVPRGTELYIIGRAEGWFAIEHAGRTAFVHPAWVRRSPPAAST
jgi:hypothetical protein